MMEFTNEYGKRMRRPYEFVKGIDESPTGAAIITLEGGQIVSSTQMYDDVYRSYIIARDTWLDAEADRGI